jgi:hypothetical protein
MPLLLPTFIAKQKFYKTLYLTISYTHILVFTTMTNIKNLLAATGVALTLLVAGASTTQAQSLVIRTGHPVHHRYHHRPYHHVYHRPYHRGPHRRF